MPDTTDRRMPTAAEAAAELLRRQAAEDDFHEFVKQAWHVVEPAVEFCDNWHIEAICLHLEALYHGRIKNLLVNVPPRASKSLLISVLYPAWVWIREPGHRWLCCSYSNDLSVEHNRACRELIRSSWYKTRWGDRFTLLEDQDTKTRFENNLRGYRISTAVNAKGTGLGASTIICDDPNAANDTSKAVLDSTNAWFDGTLSTRLNDRRTGHKIVVQQRLHERDLTGHILSGTSKDDWTFLRLPLEYEAKSPCATIKLRETDAEPWRDPRTKEKELLWPSRWDSATVATMKAELGSEYARAGQLQQRPSPGEGGIIKKDWFQWWKQKETPRLIFILQSWDTATDENELNAYSACTTWGVFKDDKEVYNVILLSAWRGHLEYPELRRLAQMMAEDYRDDNIKAPRKKVKRDETKRSPYKPHMVLVEAKLNGKALIQDLHRAGVLAHAFVPDRHGGKIERVRLVSPIIEGGRLWVAAMPPAFTQLYPSADMLVEAAGQFPNGASLDVIDTMSQALLRLETSGWVGVPTDPPPVEPDPLRQLAQQTEAIY